MAVGRPAVGSEMVGWAHPHSALGMNKIKTVIVYIKKWPQEMADPSSKEYDQSFPEIRRDVYIP